MLISMPVKKIGQRWFPLKKNGQPWKGSGFPSKAKAEAAITANKKRLAGLSKKNPKKKAKKSAQVTAGGNVAAKDTKKHNNKMSPGKIMDRYLLGAEAITQTIQAAQGIKDPMQALGDIIGSYTSVNPVRGDFKPSRLGRGYAPVLLSRGLRSAMKAGGVPSLPTTKPKTIGEMLDNLSFYGPTIIEAVVDGQKDPERIHRIAVKNFSGIGLVKDSDELIVQLDQPLKKSYGPYYLQRRIRRFLRENFGLTLGKM